jgi:hypothetical protein
MTMTAGDIMMPKEPDLSDEAEEKQADLLFGPD